MHYFKKYRGLATGIKFCSDPVSAIIFPPVLVYLETTYGLSGALLVFGALTMHVTAFCIPLKEAPWHKRSTVEAEVATVALGLSQAPPAEAKRSSHLNRRQFRIPGSLPTLPPELRLPSFYVATVGAALIDYINAVHLSTIVDYALDMGVPRLHAELTVTYGAAPEMAGRVLLPLAADLGIVSRPVLSAVILLVLGALFTATPIRHPERTLRSEWPHRWPWERARR
ncbi:hypothetical protein HPB48_009896 [Haemaphysalis longicornis]|uniref:Monocarboxylate transporter n=1 Tax=Haemaphysalis longicornis TaxID=44386 RepID=A0A9J6GSE6_HAELO|nr:hypothetical protein HPB48_009896 [Haemaphysalis longicornis]